jgi:hypothetical protein
MVFLLKTVEIHCRRVAEMPMDDSIETASKWMFIPKKVDYCKEFRSSEGPELGLGGRF